MSVDRSHELGVGLCFIYFGDPDRASISYGADVVHEALEVGKVRRRVVPMNCHKVHLAIGTVDSQEVCEPWRSGCGIGDGRAAQLGLPSQGRHVLSVGRGGVRGRQVGLLGVVRLIESEQVGGALCNPATENSEVSQCQGIKRTRNS